MATRWGTRLLLAAMWLLHRLPLSVLAWLGHHLGRLLFVVAKSRRKVALRNLELCFPDWPEARRQALAKEHFQWLGRSLLERTLLWFGSARRLRKMIRIEGDVTLAERSERPVMWLVPHFMGLDVAGVAASLFQKHPACSMYQQQSNPEIDALVRKGRLRFSPAGSAIFPRGDKALPLIRAIRKGQAFFNLPDMDFGVRDAAFVPFFGVPAATLLAPSRMALALNMVVQPVLAEMLPGGEGYVVRFLEPWTDFPTDDPLADAAAMNRWIEAQIRLLPAQYLWVHRRFKTRPPGEPSLY